MYSNMAHHVTHLHSPCNILNFPIAVVNLLVSSDGIACMHLGSVRKLKSTCVDSLQTNWEKGYQNDNECL